MPPNFYTRTAGQKVWSALKTFGVTSYQAKWRSAVEAFCVAMNQKK